MACAIIAYTRKFIGVAIVWTHEMIVLTDLQFSDIRSVYDRIDQIYSARFPDHANQMEYPGQ